MPPDYARDFTKASPDSLGNFSMSGPANATYRNQNGDLALSVANQPRYLYRQSTACEGIMVENTTPNLATNYNAKPTDLTGLSNTGGLLSIVDDAIGLLSAAVDDYGAVVNLRTYVCTTGKLIQLDNSAGTGPAYLEFAGVATNTSAAHSISLYAQTPTGSTLSFGATAASAAVASPSGLTRLMLDNFVPADITSKVRLTIPPGGTAKVILNQFEVLTKTSSVIIVSGASVTRAAEGGISDNSIATRSYFSQTQGTIMVDLSVDEIFNPATTFLSIQNGANSTTYGQNNMSTVSTAQTGRLKTGAAAGSTKAVSLYGSTAGQSGVSIHSLDVSRESYPVGFSWNTAAGSFVSYAGPLDEQAHSIGAFTATLDHLQIGGRTNNAAGLLSGTIRSIKIWSKQVPTIQLGQQVNFAGWKIVSNNGQSPFSTIWASHGVQGVDYGPNFNDGEKAFIREMKKTFPNNRCAVPHLATDGSSISQATSTANQNSWYILATNTDGPLLPRALSILQGLVAGGAEVIGHIISPHVSDSNQNQANLKAAFDHVLGKILALPANQNGTKTIGQTKILFQRTARREDATGNDTNYFLMKQFEAYYAALYGYTLGTERVNEAVCGDGGHLTDLALAHIEPFDVRLMLSKIGYTISGPVDCIDIASASISGQQITITLAYPTGVTDILQTADIQSFEFFDQDGAPGTDAGPSGPRIAFSSVTHTPGTNIVVATLASTPAHAGLLVSNFGVMWTNTAAAPNTYAPVLPAKLVKGNDQYGMPLRTRVMALPFAGQ